MFDEPVTDRPVVAGLASPSLLEVNEQLVRTLLRTQEQFDNERRAAHEARRLATLDPLTRLPTRMQLIDRFAQAAALADRRGGRLALLFLDLDGFKQVNDSVGHAAGDRLLTAVARCLVLSVRASDTVSRHGGDEFLILLTEIVHDSDAATTSAKMLQALAALPVEGAEGARITGSIGISFYPDHGKDVQALISRADAAMYCAKAVGRGQYRIHNEIAPADRRGRSPVGSRTGPSGDPHARLLADDGGHEDERHANEGRPANASLGVADDPARAEQHLQVALEAAGMGRWELDLQTGKMNRSIRHDALFGDVTPQSDWSIDTTLMRFVPGDRPAVAAAFQEAVTTGSLEFEHRIEHAGDGRIRWLHLAGRTLFRNGVPWRIVGVISDVTDRRAAEDRLRQSQKLEAIGRLTGGIAHDFNNLLLVIGGSAELLASRIAADERSGRLVDAIRRAVANGSKLNRQLLAFARKQEPTPEVVAIRQLMPVFEDLLDRATNATIAIELSCEDEPWPCYLDCHQLEVAVLNLAINARDAMPSGGKLTLDARNVVVDHATATRRSSREGKFVRISLSDTGAGMPGAVIARAFEPFFTTKPIGQGTGLGLSQVDGFARQSGGFVTIERRAEGGTTVAIHLPRSHRIGSPAPANDPLIAPQAGRSASILVVEHDPDVRTTTTAMLVDLGYRVVEAASADAAMALIASGRHVDLVFSDIVMHGIGGVEFAMRLRRDRGVPVLLTSGCLDRDTLPDDVAPFLPILRKPFTRADLDAALKSALDGAAAPRT